MSILVVAYRLAGRPRLFQTRQLVITFGEDYYGLLNWANLQKDFFTVESVGSSYTLTALAHGLQCDGRPLEPGNRFDLEGPVQISTCDYAFKVMGTSATAETLSHLPVAAKRIPEEAGHLEFTLGGFRRRFPLFEGIDTLIGSSTDSPICIPIPGIAESHLSIRCEKGRALVRPIDGTITGEGNAAAEQALPLRLSLQPTGLELRVEAAG